MIVLDTNVISEAMKPEPHPAVRAWLNRILGDILYSPRQEEISFKKYPVK